MTQTTPGLTSAPSSRAPNGQGLHPHAFRHFVATRLDNAGWTTRQIADYLGHDRISMTQDEYMDRHIAGMGSTLVLPEIPPTSPPQTGG